MAKAAWKPQPNEAVQPRLLDPSITELACTVYGVEHVLPVVRRSARELTGDWSNTGKRRPVISDVGIGRPAIRLNGGGVLVDADTSRILAVYIEPGSSAFGHVAGVLAPARPSGETHRQRGLSGLTTVFGYMPRKLGRQNWCRGTLFQRKHASAAHMLDELTVEFARLYEHFAPELYRWHMEQLTTMQRAYVMADGPYTSGIINYEFGITYHRDAGNVVGAWSAMLGFRRTMRGGELLIPAYDVILPIADGSLSLFDGQSVLHGVTPMHAGTRDSYRMTVVFYTLENMWECLEPADELARYRKERTAHERRRRDKHRKARETGND